MRSGEGGVYAFKGIRVARRTNPARCAVWREGGDGELKLHAVLT